MEQEQAGRVGRRLSAIVAADVAGYSRLMGVDEIGTARILREHRAVSDALVAKHGGRIVKTTGDGLLLEFPSVVDAVECAVAVQAAMTKRNDGVPEDRRMLFRIGINLGDILIEGDDILGDGVNIAARLEGIAEPGRICISSSAYDQVQGKVAVEFADLGDQQLKNIARPIRAFAVIHNGQGAQARAAGKHLPALPSLSIVVLPFANIGGDPEQDYFVDGVTESLTTDLSRINGSFVIARSTAFTFKRKAVDVKKVGRELHVRYVLEGSVQRAGNRLRVNVQLIDAEGGTHLWAERFDKPVADLFHGGKAEDIPPQGRHFRFCPKRILRGAALKHVEANFEDVVTMGSSGRGGLDMSQRPTSRLLHPKQRSTNQVPRHRNGFTIRARVSKGGSRR